MALVALVVSILAFVWTIAWSVWLHLATTRAKVLVTGTFARALDSGEEIFAIQALNTGSVPVTLKTAFVKLDDPDKAKSVTFARFEHEKPELVCVLQPGHHWEGLLTAEQFRQAVHAIPGGGGPPWRVRVGVKDAAARFHCSEWLVVASGPQTPATVA